MFPTVVSPACLAEHGQDADGQQDHQGHKVVVRVLHLLSIAISILIAGS